MASSYSKGSILVVGLELEASLFSRTISGVGQAVADFFNAKWLYTYVFTPFQIFLSAIMGFNFSLETLSVTCAGSSAPPKLLSNLFVLGVVICLIQSEFAIYKAVTHDTLATKFLTIACMEHYNTWSPVHYRATKISANELLAYQDSWSPSFFVPKRIRKNAKFIDNHMIGVVIVCCLTQFVSVMDVFQSALQWLASKVALGDFVRYKGVLHPWDNDCNHIEGYPYFDMGLAVSASVVGWVMLFPSMYLISSVLIPGLPVFAKPLVTKEEKVVAKLPLNTKWYGRAWKYISLVAPDLWCAEAAQHWLFFVKSNIPYDAGPRAPSVSQAEKQIKDPVRGRKSKRLGKTLKGLREEEDFFGDSTKGTQIPTQVKFLRMVRQSVRASILAIRDFIPDAQNENQTDNENGMSEESEGDVELRETGTRNVKAGTFENDAKIDRDSSGHDTNVDIVHTSTRKRNLFAQLERPDYAKLRVVVTETKDTSENESENENENENENKTSQILSIFMCEREINTISVWRQIYQHTPPLAIVSDLYTIMYFNTKTGKVDRASSHEPYKKGKKSSMDLIVKDLNDYDEHSNIVFIKWGASSTCSAEGNQTVSRTPDERFVRCFEEFGGNTSASFFKALLSGRESCAIACSRNAS